ncbi:hypothetical protein HBB16_16790 [Pseudonocardia sp. MCCB 268]|nr:hypothetical protein [Pseudonocardia cytotoxica]
MLQWSDPASGWPGGHALDRGRVRSALPAGQATAFMDRFGDCLYNLYGLHRGLNPIAGPDDPVRRPRHRGPRPRRDHPGGPGRRRNRPAGPRLE